METEQAVTALAALAQETRLRAFRLLVQQGLAGLPAGEIAERSDRATADAFVWLLGLRREKTVVNEAAAD